VTSCVILLSLYFSIAVKPVAHGEIKLK